MSNWEVNVHTGDPNADQAQIAQLRQQAATHGMEVTVQPSPAGGYIVRAVPAGQAGYGGGGYGAMAASGVPSSYGPGAVVMPGAQTAAPPLGRERIQYLRKVYGLLTGAAFIAIAAGYLAINVGEPELFHTPDGIPVQVPGIVALMLGNRMIMYAMFGALFAGTFIASAVSKVKVLNVIALFGVGALIGVQIAPMVFVAQVFAGLGRTMSATPVRDAGAMTAAVFLGITIYVFYTRKDFSYLRAALNMGVWVIFAACLLTFVFHSEIFGLAVASAGALLSIGFLLYVTSYIFRNSEMDDPVGDALVLLVQLRNLFMFLLRIFMSSRD